MNDSICDNLTTLMWSAVANDTTLATVLESGILHGLQSAHGDSYLATTILHGNAVNIVRQFEASGRPSADDPSSV